jgi:hypothetical protein
MPRQARVANPGQHVGDRVGHVHGCVCFSSAVVRLATLGVDAFR